MMHVVKFQSVAITILKTMFSVCYFTMKELLVYQIIHHSGHITLFEGLVLKCDKGMHSGRRTCFLEGETGQ
jgi:hypothetical protein